MKKCLWCLDDENEKNFDTKAHTIPKSLGGQKFNNNVCDECNTYFGNRQEYSYSIEEALKEAFIITRKRLMDKSPKRKIGRFKSKFFEVKERKGKIRLIIKSSFRFTHGFQANLCRAFKRGLYKLFLEEYNRQKGHGFESSYDFIRRFARYNEGDLPVLYFIRSQAIILATKNEFISPELLFDRMKYLLTSEDFVEIEFLGHVFGFPITEFTPESFNSHVKKSIELKTGLFKSAVLVKKMTDVDITLNIFNS